MPSVKLTLDLEVAAFKKAVADAEATLKNSFKDTGGKTALDVLNADAVAIEKAARRDAAQAAKASRQQEVAAAKSAKGQELASAQSLKSAEIAARKEVSTVAVKARQQEAEAARRASESIGSLKQLAGGIFAGIGIGVFVKEVLQAADASSRMQSQLRLVTKSEEELIGVQRRLFDLSQETRTSLSSTIELYSRMARNTESLNISQDRLVSLTRAVNQSLQLSGATTQEATGGVIQFGQALAAGFQGDELRSIIESIPRLAKAIGDGLNLTQEQFKEFVKDASRDEIIRALESQAERIDKEFQKLAPRIDGTIQKIQNALQFAFVGVDSGPLVKELDDLSKILERPETVEAIQQLASGIINLVAAGASGLPTVVNWFKNLVDNVSLVTVELSAAFDTASAFINLISTADLSSFKNQIVAISSARRDSIDAIGEEKKAREDAAKTATDVSKEVLRNEHINIQEQIRLAKEAKDAKIDSAKDVLEAEKDFLKQSEQQERSHVSRVKSLREELTKRRDDRAILAEDEKLKSGDIFGFELAQFARQREASRALAEGRVEDAKRIAETLEEQAQKLAEVSNKEKASLTTLFLKNSAAKLVEDATKKQIEQEEKAAAVEIEKQRGLLAQIKLQENLVAALKKGATDIDALKPKLTVETNFVEVEKQIDSILGKIGGLDFSKVADAGKVPANPYIAQAAANLNSTPIILQLPGGQQFPMAANQDVARDLQALLGNEALKAGRRL